MGAWAGGILARAVRASRLSVFETQRRMTIEQGFIALGSSLAALAVGLGAFGAHALRRRLTPDRLETFETGVRYHMYHSLALLAAAFVSSRFPSSPLAVASGWLFVAGIILFSGSLISW